MHSLLRPQSPTCCFILELSADTADTALHRLHKTCCALTLMDVLSQMFKEDGEPCCEWGDKSVRSVTHIMNWLQISKISCYYLCISPSPFVYWLLACCFVWVTGGSHGLKRTTEGRVEVAGGLIGFWLCGQSKGPHQSHPTGASHNLPCLFSSVYVSATQCNQQDMRREMDEGEEDGEAWDGGKHQDGNRRRCLCKQSQTKEAERSGKTAADCRGDRSRDERKLESDRRDVVALCLQGTVTQYTVTLCVGSAEFVMGYHS